MFLMKCKFYIILANVTNSINDRRSLNTFLKEHVKTVESRITVKLCGYFKPFKLESCFPRILSLTLSGPLDVCANIIDTRIGARLPVRETLLVYSKLGPSKTEEMLVQFANI